MPTSHIPKIGWGHKIRNGSHFPNHALFQVFVTYALELVMINQHTNRKTGRMFHNKQTGVVWVVSVTQGHQQCHV